MMTVDVVIVAYNRLEKLKKALLCYERQTSPFRNMIVVNNHSTDRTTEFLEEWSNVDSPFAKDVITTEENLGGLGGGFYWPEESYGAETRLGVPCWDVSKNMWP